MSSGNEKAQSKSTCISGWRGWRGRGNVKGKRVNVTWEM